MPLNKSRNDVLAGALDMLVLRTLSIGEAHGYAIARHIESVSKDVLRVEQGSLYPALDRLLKKGLVTAEWRNTPTGRRARYYAITPSGKKLLGERLAEYERITAAIRLVMRES